MHLTGLIDLLRQNSVYNAIRQPLQNGQSQVWPVLRSARPVVLASLAADWPGPIIYLTARGKRTHNVVEQLPIWLPDSRAIYRFAEPTPMFYDRLPWDQTVVRERLETLQALLFADHAQSKPLVIASARALMQRTMPAHQFRTRTTHLRVGQPHTIEGLIRAWMGLGYEAVTMVSEPGTFTRRGGIVDVYPVAAEWPVRIEYFGDEVDTLRTFDPSTQRTIAALEQVRIIPAREALPELMPQVGRHLSAWFASLGTDGDDLMSTVQDLEALNNAQSFAYLEHYLPYIYDNPVSLLDYAPDDTLIILEDHDDLKHSVEQLMEKAAANRESNLNTAQLPDDYPLPYVAWHTLAADLENKTSLHLSAAHLAEREEGQAWPPVFEPGRRFGGQLRSILRHIRERRDAAERLVVVTQQVGRLQNIWYEQDNSEFIPKLQALESVPQMGTVVFVQGALGEGWAYKDESATLHLITDAEIFGWSRPEPRRRKSSKSATKKLPESDYSDWNAGDYVVHVDYGIGRFQGLGIRTLEGNEREYLRVEYASNGLLFVPIHQADRLTRYVGPDETPPKMSALGKQEIWTKTKEKARKAAYEEAKELLQIYAARASAAGFAFSPDSPWQRELDASFPYVETEDQLRVIREIKRDMESRMPMDRLVCGDVGYGKTEVALRAAFKAVMDGKQVAILVPTTVLANQHYETFSRRMAAFPIQVELLSRFRTKAEQNKVIAALAQGYVDIIIGTHRILSDDIQIPNLGLAIIDEEQRFGVKHKEHFKKLRAQIDVLTLTATPIPRTLYMSLSGVRDISMLQTPPEDRLPVITHVSAFDPKLARQAILREIDRGGQVFVIHNRVKSIDMLREKLETIVPEASIAVAHGQMSGRQLERVISEFSRGSYDILLATSIIENGIDMPNVNTLIVDRADWFGMAQLYQIRGRVGRGATQAYAYFFHAGGRKLTVEARERLETLAEHTHLGAGFQISIRDLELRGGGDILSTRQTGHVATVGLQLYTQLLQQAVSELKGEAAAVPAYEQERIIIDLPIPAYIPTNWIMEMALRLQLYRRIGGLQKLGEVEALRQELRDRFGILPQAVEGLLYQIQVKLMAVSINARSVIKPREHILIKLPWLAAVDREALALQLGEDVEVSRTAVALRYDAALWQLRLIDILQELKDGLPEQVGI